MTDSCDHKDTNGETGLCHGRAHGQQEGTGPENGTEQQLKPPAWLYVRCDVACHSVPPAFFSFKIKWTTHTTRRGARSPFDWRHPFVFCVANFAPHRKNRAGANSPNSSRTAAVLSSTVRFELGVASFPWVALGLHFGAWCCL